MFWVISLESQIRTLWSTTTVVSSPDRLECYSCGEQTTHVGKNGLLCGDFWCNVFDQNSE